MFSKALYKQSWKANWVQWLAVTVVSCFILVIIMTMSSGDGIGSLTGSMAQSFAKDTLQSSFKDTAINYNYVGNESLVEFDKGFLDGYVVEIVDNPYQAPTQDNIANAYTFAMGKYQSEVDKKINEIDSSYNSESDAYKELLGSAMFTLNPNGVMSDIYEQYEPGSTPQDYDIMTLIVSIDSDDMMDIWTTGNAPSDLYDVTSTLVRSNYRSDRSRSASAIFMAGNMSSEEAVDAIVDELKDAGIDKETYDTFGFDYTGLKKIGTDAILEFQARLDYEISLLNRADYPSNEAYDLEISRIKTDLQKSITATVMDKLPDALRDSLADMETQDMYTMIVGNMYFKIVGLLISVVFVIIIGINLIVGQVDSGSMAYVLSTGTKRNTVTLTQILFFVSSTLFLFLATSIVSSICFLVIPPALTSVTLGKLLLFNLGAFLVTMAIGGVIFLSSCVFNRTKRAMALGGGFAVLTIVFTILGMFASDATPSMMRMDALNGFNYVSIVTLFDVFSIVNGTTDFIWKFVVLGLVSIVCFAIGVIVFKKKDLPL